MQEIELVTPKEVTKEIKAPGLDLNTKRLLKRFPRNGIVKFTNLINATLKLKHVPIFLENGRTNNDSKPRKSNKRSKIILVNITTAHDN